MCAGGGPESIVTRSSRNGHDSAGRRVALQRLYQASISHEEIGRAPRVAWIVTG